MSEQLYKEKYRPQFHFTARQGWLNDPNGLVWYDGEYHLFFQHNPHGTNWGNMTWGHAVSTDLVHWRQLPNAIEPDALGTIFSGSAAVDWNNSAGFQTGREKSLVALYTAAGNTSPESKGQPDTQCLAFSNDRGRSWTKYDGNPVLANIAPGNRDPRIFWHARDKHWVMALYVCEQGETGVIHAVHFFSSTDLKKWTMTGRMDGFFECPDLFEIPLDDPPLSSGRTGEATDTRWVLFGADGNYVIGRFDAGRFVPESRKHAGDFGEHFYAAQTFNDTPDGRRILIGWMRGGEYPDMPFNQQMTFPCELTLRTFPEGIRLCKQPVREIALLRGKKHSWRNLEVGPGQNPLAGINGELFDIEAEIEIGTATDFGFDIRGYPVAYMVGDNALFWRNRSAHMNPVDGRIRIRIVVDRTSAEVFGNDGFVTFSSCFRQDIFNHIGFYSSGGTVRLHTLQVHELKPACELRSSDGE